MAMQMFLWIYSLNPYIMMASYFCFRFWVSQ